eukprot:CAMPEP_0194583628 /NCGR_PEP_ID=MMETSP0292-20121207/16472_1 /TAXON_ID=39354 /ORGANISM="Heterosigma akashiwo, Strain CCMP2393" /LENGTH=219 /DNA_ID=CAMNT_0039438325 /DNA_START=89 /DNA_END=748 /DNA_ORIENTATION=-
MHGRKKADSIKSPEELAAREEKVKKYTKLLSIISGLRSNGVKSDEALNLLSTALRLNPDNYSLWNYRREILLEVYSKEENGVRTLTLEEDQRAGELQLTQDGIGRNPKSYPAWHQRQWLIIHLDSPDLSQELDLCALFLQRDGRNFHCWNYRQFIVNKMGRTPAEEMEFLTPSPPLQDGVPRTDQCAATTPPYKQLESCFTCDTRLINCSTPSSVITFN